MKITSKLAIIATTFLLTLCSVSSAAPVLQVSNGILIGAHNVNVLGKLYDVSFRSGTCVEIYGSCSTSSFQFNYLDSQNAAFALLDQVLIDGPYGNFDSTPTSVFGCIDSRACKSFVPYLATPTSGIYASTATNYNQIQDALNIYVGFDDSFTVGNNYAYFTIAAADSTVPEPGTIALAGLGLLGLIAARRK